MEKLYLALLLLPAILHTVAFQALRTTERKSVHGTSNWKQQSHHQKYNNLKNNNRYRQGNALSLKPEWFAPDDDDEDELVTREMLHRDLLGQDASVKRKRKTGDKDGSYKPLDNRDQLPFNVTVLTPEPYTHPEIKAANAKKHKPETKKTDLDRQLAPSRLYQTNAAGKKKGGGVKDGKNNDTTYLGDFKLDKSTTSGDIIVIGEREFEVQKARCLYKYAGGQRFMMVRKILEVKEVSRVAKEEFLMRQFKRSRDIRHEGPPDLE